MFDIGWLNPRDEKSYRIDVTPFRQGFSEHALYRVKRSVILSQILKQESVEVEDESVNAWLDEQAQSESVEREQIDQMYGYPKNMKYLKELVSSKNMVDELLSGATITVEQPKPDTDTDQTAE